MKPRFSELTLKEAMQLVAHQDITPWVMQPAGREPSEILQEYLRRCFQSFDVKLDEGKLTLVDALLLEVVPSYPRLKIWKDAPLETDTASGTVDYLIAPKRAYLDTPLLCVTLARHDDFDAARMECIAQMAACRQNNRRGGHYTDTYGIVSNGQGWIFLLLIRGGEFFASGLYTFNNLPKLLGVLDDVCINCARNALMSRNLPDEGECVTLRYFHPEELHLMRNCLVAVTSDTYVTNAELQTLTGLYSDEYAALLADFGVMPQINKKQWETIRGLIGMLTGYPIDNQNKLEAFLGVSRLHLCWFSDRMLHMQEHWLYYVEVSAKQKNARAEWLTPIEESF